MVYPDQAYASSRGSYFRPVPVPTQDPNASPTLTLSIACSWLPYIRGSLEQLFLQATWDTDDPAVLALAQQRAMTLVAMFTECDAGSLPFSCPYDFTASSGGWTAVNTDSSLSPVDQAVYVGGSGWAAQHMFQASTGKDLVRCQIQRLYSPAVNISDISMVYNLTKGSPVPSGFQNGIFAYRSGSLIADSFVDSGTDPDGTGKTRALLFGSPTSIDQVICEIDCFYSTPGGSEGAALITDVEVSGVGSAGC